MNSSDHLFQRVSLPPTLRLDWTRCAQSEMNVCRIFSVTTSNICKESGWKKFIMQKSEKICIHIERHGFRFTFSRARGRAREGRGQSSPAGWRHRKLIIVIIWELLEMFFFCSSISNLIRSLLGCSRMRVHLLQNSSGGLVKCFCSKNRTIGKHSTAASKQQQRWTVNFQQARREKPESWFYLQIMFLALSVITFNYELHVVQGEKF